MERQRDDNDDEKTTATMTEMMMMMMMMMPETPPVRFSGSTPLSLFELWAQLVADHQCGTYTDRQKEGRHAKEKAATARLPETDCFLIDFDLNQ
ncbi:unnamed protein product [Linum trigynum]|uniref:Uncharacterized protein n=1 Tax=Linum trigynum TaxID=586398 RepID=A0AAV2G8X7_9ROSI